MYLFMPVHLYVDNIGPSLTPTPIPTLSLLATEVIIIHKPIVGDDETVRESRV